MPSSNHAELPSESIQSPSTPTVATTSSLDVPKMRQASRSERPPQPQQQPQQQQLPIRTLPLSYSEASLPMRQPTPTTASLYASTLTPPGSRSMSPVGFGVRPDRIGRIGSLPAAPARTFSLSSTAGTSADATTSSMARTASSETTATSTTSGSTATGSHRHQQAAAAARGAPFLRSLLESPAVADNPGDPLRLLLKAFVPHVAVFASRDTDALAREKGFAGGLWELLRPFGEQVPGKVHVRDSNGASRAWNDFSVRFARFGDHVETPASVQGVVPPVTSPPPPLTQEKNGTPKNATADRIPLVEAIVDKHLRFAESTFLVGGEAAGSAAAAGPPPLTPSQAQQQHHDLSVEHTSPYYSLYLRRLLSGLPVACHETFAHPVACVIAISSRNTAPIQTFQELYHAISEGEQRLPPWVDGEFLRYYVLVHDEDHGDIVQSVALFEQMKRKLGLHCHLLRIRSAAATAADDDSLQLPRSDWMTAVEEYADLVRGEDDDASAASDPTRYLFESDAAAISTFVREMVTQSIVPTMERNVSTWNDQWASRRKGLSGRFVSLSRRWAGFGSIGSGGGGAGAGSSGGGSGSGSGGGSGGSNYDAQRGFYRADSSEAILRKLADYAFMLRDWKLAMSTYDILRTDFTNDKAWRYHAAANEMCGLALLIMAPAQSSRTKLDTVQGVLEQAWYSYVTRCGHAYGGVRTVALALELLRLRGGRAAVDAAVRWGTRLLEARLVGPVGDALLRERMAVCCATRPGSGPLGWGSWRRKAAFWSVLAAEAWVRQGKYIQAQRGLNEARNTYSMLQSDEGISGFALARQFMADLQQQLKQGLTMGVEAVEDRPPSVKEEEEEEEEGEADPTTTDQLQHERHGKDDNDADAEVEVLVDDTAEKRARRRSRHNSLLVGSGAGLAGLESAPLQRRRRLSTAGVVAEEPAEAADAEAARPAADSGFGQV